MVISHWPFKARDPAKTKNLCLLQEELGDTQAALRNKGQRTEKSLAILGAREKKASKKTRPGPTSALALLQDLQSKREVTIVLTSIQVVVPF